MTQPQQSPWEHLLRMLDEAQSVFQQYLGLLSHEECQLRSVNRQELHEVNARKEHVLDAMCQIEQQVERELYRLAGAEGHDTIGTFLKKSRNPQAQTASALLSGLVNLAGAIQEQGKQNEAMIGRIQQRIREAILFMHTGLGTAPVYQGSGSLHFPPVPGAVHLQG